MCPEPGHPVEHRMATVANGGPECYIWGMDKIILHIPHSTPCTDFSAWSNQEAVRNEHD